MSDRAPGAEPAFTGGLVDRVRALRSWRPDVLTIREARSDAVLLACLAALVALLTAAAAAAPPLMDRLAGHALLDRVAAVQANGPGLQFSSALEIPHTKRTEPVTFGRDLDDSGKHIMSAAPVVLTDRLVARSARVELPPVAATIGDESVALGLLYANDAPRGRSYTAGRAPGENRSRVEIAVSARTADVLGLRVGQRLTLRQGSLPVTTPAVVAGVFELGSQRIGREVPLLGDPLKVPGATTGIDRQATALTSPGALERLQRSGQVQLSATWNQQLDLTGAEAIRFSGAHGSAELQRGLYQYGQLVDDSFCRQDADGYQVCTVGAHGASPLTMSSQLPDMAARFTTEWHRAEAVISFSLVSLISVGLATCVVTALLAVRRRLDAHRLQRARGAAALGLAATRAGQTAPVVLIGMLVGLAVAWSVAPSGASSPAYGTAAVVAALAWLVLPALTWNAVRDRAPRRPADGRDGARAGARRITAEATVLLLAAAGVLALRTRGMQDATDPQLAAVPALLGLATVLLLVRCYPPPVRFLARWSARRRGAVPMIALARAAKDAPARALALLVLVITLGTAVFSSLVAGTIAEGRRTAADWHVGADASYAGAQADPETAQKLSRAPGVRHRVTVSRTSAALIGAEDGGNYGRADLVSLDASELGAAAPGSPAAAALSRAPRAGHGAVPVLTGPGLPVGTTYTSTLRGRTLTFTVVGRLTDDAAHDPALGPVLEDRDSRVLLADAAALTGFRAKDQEEKTLLLYGSAIDADVLRGIAPRATVKDSAGELRIRSEAEARDRDDGVLVALSTAHTVCSLLAALLAFVALVLDLLLSAPERGRTAAKLRTLGLGTRAVGGLQILQLLPMALAAAAGGVALGAALPALLGPALKLRYFTGGPAEPALHADYAPVALLGVGFAVLIAAAVAAETWLARRRGLGAVLRVGENGT
ncbi:hypothetical protein OG609_09835 [Streptomyces sp. NBC_01224]|uniref:FtsX-like permease family protein n=1 Tax=Streptomyces sp. NBC_01224 TaxID=2903783 RepID=UPI002E15551F|nr:hypothetical protein OG609_09835 [Streptomyces sp. NBC_01224]